MKNKNIIELTKPQLKKFWEENSDYLKYTFGRKIIADVAKFKYDDHQNQQLVKEYVELNEKGTSQLRQFNRLNYVLIETLLSIKTLIYINKYKVLAQTIKLFCNYFLNLDFT